MQLPPPPDRWRAPCSAIPPGACSPRPTWPRRAPRSGACSSLIGTLLTWQPHSLSDALREHGKPLAPRHVKVVEEYIHANAAAELTPALLAEVAGVSVRSLFAGFREHRGTGPMAYLRTVRLERVRHDLLNNASVTSVSAAALRWGFAHLGRFSAEYRRSFGECPAQTLRRREAG